MHTMAERFYSATLTNKCSLLFVDLSYKRSYHGLAAFKQDV